MRELSANLYSDSFQLSQVNLNNMLCPAISDPFRGRFWRMAASVHQSVYIPLHTKLYSLFAQLVLGAYRQFYWAPLGAENKLKTSRSESSMLRHSSRFHEDNLVVKKRNFADQNGMEFLKNFEIVENGLPPTFEGFKME